MPLSASVRGGYVVMVATSVTRAGRPLALRNARTAPAGMNTVLPAGARRLLRDAAAADSTLREHLAAEVDRRCGFQRTLVDLVHACGPLRDGLTAEQAADTYSALANPDLYLLLTIHHGWTPGQYQPGSPTPSNASSCRHPATQIIPMSTGPVSNCPAARR